MSEETPENQPVAKSTFSILGLSSAILSITPFFSFFLPIASSDGGTFLFMALIFGSPPIALILGIIALTQKNRQRVFALIGVIISGTAVMLFLGIALLGFLLLKSLGGFF